jgi:CTD nuclear envelope phosphatase 1
MNSLNRIAARVSPSQTPSPSRTSSFGNVLSLPGHSEARRSSRDGASIEKGTEELLPIETPHEGDGTEDLVDEKTPLLVNDPTTSTDLKPFESRSAPDRIIRAIMNSLRWVVSTLTAPAVYLIAFLYDDRGRFAPFSRGPEFGPGGYNGRPLAHATNVLPSGDDHSLQGNHATGELSGRRSSVRPTRRPLSSSSSSGLSSESESEHPTGEQDKELTSSTARHTRSKSLQNSDEIAPARRSIRIKLHADDSVRQRRHRKAQSTSSPAGPSISPEALKSPTSPAISAMTKYPRAPAPPRPLIPRRQPSYSIADASNGKLAQKTLVLDLDETLIHSIAKGGRMSTGHMVEVRLNTVMGDNIGPQHPILYYVNKRPHCDDFLRSVSLSRKSEATC